MSKRKTNDEFITESIEIHGNKYDYSQVNYIRNCIKVDLICPIHGLFSVRPNDHLSKKVGCNKCNNASISKSKNVGKTIIDIKITIIVFIFIFKLLEAPFFLFLLINSHIYFVHVFSFQVFYMIF